MHRLCLCCRSGQSFHEQPRQGTLGCGQWDIPIPKRHLECMSVIDSCNPVLEGFTDFEMSVDVDTGRLVRNKNQHSSYEDLK